MTALDRAFAKARAENRRALLPFLMSGYPSRERFRADLAEAARFADVLEVGVPFSDPLADGPVIQAAAAAALREGTTLARTLEDIATLPAGAPPVVLMLSCNQVLARGLGAFAAAAAAARVAALIVPDVPLEESAPLEDALTTRGLALVRMLAPTTPEARMGRICAGARGFLYAISVAGVTGTRDSLPPGVEDYIRLARRHAPVPLCLGFGISRPEQVRTLAPLADGFVVGSALIRLQQEGKPLSPLLGALRDATAIQGDRS